MRGLALGEEGSLEAMAAVLGADEVLLLPGPAPRRPGARLRSGRGGRGAARRGLRRQARAADRHARAARGLQPPRAPVDALPARPRPHPRAPARAPRGQAARLRYGDGVQEVRESAWVYGVDALLVPLGFAAALATREAPAAPAVILPLAALLAFFAHERRSRAAHAATLQTIVQHASDLILVVEPDGRLKSALGSAALLAGEGTLLDRVHPDDAAGVADFLARATGEHEWRLRQGDGSWRHVAGVAADLTERPPRRRARADDPRRRGAARAAPSRDARPADRAREPRALPRAPRGRPARGRGGRALRRSRRLQAGQRPASVTRRATRCCGSSRAGCWPACARRTPSRGSAATSSRCCSASRAAPSDVAARVQAAFRAARCSVGGRAARDLGQRRRRVGRTATCSPPPTARCTRSSAPPTRPRATLRA